MEQTDQKSVLSLANKVSELAELQNSHGPVQQEEFIQAIQPWFLPDVGAPVAGGTYDSVMLILLSGMERSESQWKDLLNSIGLEVKKVWRKDGVGEGAIEAKKR